MAQQSWAALPYPTDVHPILENRQRLIFYLIAWLPIGAILTVILKRGMLSWPEAILVTAPMSLLYAFMCLSAWYVCLAAPMRGQDSVTRPLLTLSTAAVLSSAIWFALGEVWVLAIEPWVNIPGMSERYITQFPPIFLNGVMLYLLAAAVHYLLIALDESRAVEKRSLELQVLAREAELRALRAQIDPHFLFNSLNSISALTVSDPKGARSMCLLLADFLRTSLVLGAKQQISVSEELRLVEGFLSIEKVRYGARLSVVRSVDPACDGCLVPPLLIQPLVENAIRHGIAPLLEGGTVRLDVHRAGEAIEITLENPVDPIGGASVQSGAGLGLENVRSRLAKLFSSQAAVNVSRSEGLFQVRLRFPCIRFGETQ
jgi:two-component system, LytTR family, sensor histidine kinase AlgZ